ncbi:hypothetical protein CYL18_09610 [Pradoshia eiseniae]|uniref:Uncharacterized protein n=1 Tax=Pradoshia eiseniae TaxID=2064768 RepID=A0A2S7N0I3_9BACI|nr:hypothetical protein [Pradoshia eiseniae]PQD95529.1 hypothetical protein CYL18_09610 [Pradoshia eiseniae]
MIFLIWFSFFALFFLYYINRLSTSFCIKKEIPEERQDRFYRTINVLITILLVSTYLEILYAT